MSKSKAIDFSFGTNFFHKLGEHMEEFENKRPFLSKKERESIRLEFESIAERYDELSYISFANRRFDQDVVEQLKQCIDENSIGSLRDETVLSFLGEIFYCCSTEFDNIQACWQEVIEYLDNHEQNEGLKLLVHNLLDIDYA